MMDVNYSMRKVIMALGKVEKKGRGVEVGQLAKPKIATSRFRTGDAI